jgi:hypothetical protein
LLNPAILAPNISNVKHQEQSGAALTHAPSKTLWPFDISSALVGADIAEFAAVASHR